MAQPPPQPPQLRPLCSECWAPEFPCHTDEGLAAAQRFTNLLYCWTVCFTKLIRQQRPDIQLSFSHADWQYSVYKPFSSKPEVAHNYKWHRDTYFIDADEAWRIIRYCPPLPLQLEPDEWKDVESSSSSVES